MSLILLASLFFVDPAPLEMPRAEAYLIRENGIRRLEDRYRRMDLWQSQSVDGRWTDSDGRVFLLARLETLPPERISAETMATRSGFLDSLPKPRRRDPKAIRPAIAELAGFPIAEESTSPRQMPRGFAEVGYWQGTNRTVIVCAFRLEKSETWRAAVWLLADGDDYAESRTIFEDEFLSEECLEFLRQHPVTPALHRSERDLLRADARHSVAAYDAWHVTDAPEFTVLDDLKDGGSCVAMLTNEMTTLRAAYARTVPALLDGSNVLSVARLYGSRTEYLDALEMEGAESMRWSAAYWSTSRRELVAYLPEGGSGELLRTFRHEAFHQYLSYAASMISVSPWLNEGYAQYFEDGADGPKFVDPADLPPQAESLPALLMMNYTDFYGGSDNERAGKYRLALSIAYFIEKGAPKVWREPFKLLKRDYFEALLKTHDMRLATAAAFRDPQTLKLFMAEWAKFWKNQ